MNNEYYYYILDWDVLKVLIMIFFEFEFWKKIGCYVVSFVLGVKELLEKVYDINRFWVFLNGI